MPTNNLHHRRSIRLPGYDYSESGDYFITLVACGRQHLFGDIIDDRVRLNPLGRIVRDQWLQTPSIRPEIELGEYIIMPNHFHAILTINVPPDSMAGSTLSINPPVRATGCGFRTPERSERCRSPQQTEFHPNGPKPKSLGALVAGFKSAVTTQINLLRHTPGIPVWQRNYYEHIITTDREYQNIDAYITANPSTWLSDTEYS